MKTWLAAAFILALAFTCTAVVACSDSNECESYYADLCTYDSYKQDKNDEAAKQRTEWCTCITDGPDNLGSDYQKLQCTADREDTAALDPMIANDASKLMQCRVRSALLSDFKDTFVKTCYQTDGNKDCKDSAKACTDGCNGTDGSCKDSCSVVNTDGGYELPDTQKCQDCLNACYGDCSRKYPCDSMCG